VVPGLHPNRVRYGWSHDQQISVRNLRRLDCVTENRLPLFLIMLR
jgi:hypothetical protein